MIGTISPLVQEAPHRWKRSALLYVLGGSLGGALVFGMAGGIGRGAVVWISDIWRLAVAGCILLLMLLNDLRLIKLLFPGSNGSVPDSWWIKYGSNRGALMYGFVLGMGITTPIPYAAFYGLIAWDLFLANVPVGIMIGVAYGLARATPVLVASAAVRGRQSEPPRHAVADITQGLLRIENHFRICVSFATLMLLSSVSMSLLTMWL